MQLFLICLWIFIIAIICIISYDVLPYSEEKRHGMKTEYDTSIKNMKIVLFLSLAIGIVLPLVIMIKSKTETSSTVILYSGTIIGSLLSVSGAILAALITFRNQKIRKYADERAHKKLKLNNLYHTFNDYYMDNTFLGMSNERLMDDKLVYNYARDFLNFHKLAYTELTDINEKIADKFYSEFEEELKASIWILRFEKGESRSFLASLLNIYFIFQDEIAKNVLKNKSLENEADPKEIYEYTHLQVFHILEAHLTQKVITFMSEINAELKSLK